MNKKNKTLVSCIWLAAMVLGLGITGAEAEFLYKDTNRSKPKKEKFFKSSQDADENSVGGKLIIGEVEKVRVVPGDFIMKARIDTGASITSIGIDSVEIINEDGEDWAVATIDGITMKHKVVKYIYVKRHGAKPHKRPVVKLRLILGEIARNVNVSLANRGNFQYQLLIGRNFLNNRFVVDVSQKTTAVPMEYKEN